MDKLIALLIAALLGLTLGAGGCSDADGGDADGDGATAATAPADAAGDAPPEGAPVDLTPTRPRNAAPYHGKAANRSEPPYLRIVASVYPLELWIREQLEPPDRRLFEITSIVPRDADPMTYELTDGDRETLRTADIHLWDGGVFDAWMSDYRDEMILSYCLRDEMAASQALSVGAYPEATYVWMDPVVMGQLSGQFCRRLVVPFLGNPAEASFRVRMKGTQGSHAQSCQDLDFKFAQSMLAIRGTPVVTSRASGLQAFARYGVGPFIEIGPESEAEDIARAVAALEGESPVVFHDVTADRSALDELAASVGATVVEFNPMGADALVWVQIVNRAEKALLQAAVEN